MKTTSGTNLCQPLGRSIADFTPNEKRSKLVNSQNAYFMDAPSEGERLAAKVDPVAWVRDYIEPLGPLGHVLDVGCGPGSIAAAIAAGPVGQVTGVDLSALRIAQAQTNHTALNNLRFCVADAATLPFADATFDLVVSRMLMQYLPNRHAVIGELKRVLRPGGRLLLQDLDGQLLWHHPEPQWLQAALSTILHALATTGFDPMVGRKLFSLMRQHAFESIDVQLAPYHLIAGAATRRQLSEWHHKLQIATPKISTILGDLNLAASLISEFMEFLSNPDTLTYSVQFTVLGSKPKIR